MRTYIIHRRRGTAIEIAAWAYTEDKRANRIFFHKREDKTDRDCFCLLSELAAIDIREQAESVQELVDRVKRSPEMMRVLERYRSTGELKAPTIYEEYEEMLAQLPTASDAKST